MGQHKYNPNCQLAREGKLPPKPKKLSKRESERLLYAKCREILYGTFMNAYKKMQQEDEERRMRHQQFIGEIINLDAPKPDHIPQEQWDRVKEVFDKIYDEGREGE